MAEPEDKLLKDYFKGITIEANEISDMKLDTTIRKGMQGGNNTSIFVRRRYVFSLVIVLAIALLVIVPWANQITNPVRAQPPKSWGELEVYRPVIANNITIKSAIDAGFLKEMAVSSEEVDGVQLTVNGIVVDRRGIAVLYTIQNSTDQNMHLMGLSLKKAPTDKYYLSGYSGFSTNIAKDAGAPGTSRMIEQMVWDLYQDELPDKLYLTLRVIPHSTDGFSPSSEIRNLNVEIPIAVDENLFQGKILEPSESISISGQKIKMDNVYVGPTGIYMRESFGGGNTMRVFDVLSPKLIIGRGDDQEELMRASGTSFTNVYYNDNMRPDEPIKLVIEGIVALDKSKVELVINTETQEILKAPDSHLSISERMNDEEQGVVVLDFFIPKKEKETFENNGFTLNDNFVDSSGSGHWLQHVKEDYSGYREFEQTSKGSIITYYFNVGKDKLPQPLTFKFTFYPNVFMEKDFLRIR